jgi:hypothetical protein
MSLIPCPHCSRELSATPDDLAHGKLACPICGRDFTAEGPPRVRREPTKPAAPRAHWRNPPMHSHVNTKDGHKYPTKRRRRRTP